MLSQEEYRHNRTMDTPEMVEALAKISEQAEENKRLRLANSEAAREGGLLEAEAKVAVIQIRQLRTALEKYKYCRHACMDCFCTAEARAALESNP